jgi:RimJ/RimL family protein N-acetyltransferase
MKTELQPFTKADYKNLISWIRNPDELFVWSATSFTFPLDEIQLDRHCLEVDAPGANRLIFKVIDHKTKEHIGHVELTRMDMERRKASIAFILVDPGKRGLGYGKGVMENIFQECFQKMGMKKLDLFVFDFNTRAVDLYKKMGFEIEQVMDKSIRWEGEYKTLYLMGRNNDMPSA